MSLVITIPIHQPLQPGRVEDDDVIEALAPHGSDEPFAIRVLPRRMQGREDGVNAHRVCGVRPAPERAIAVPDQKPWSTQAATTLPGLEQTDALAMPSDDRFGFDDEKVPAPVHGEFQNS